MAWDLLAPENLQNRHIDHDLKVVYVYMEVLREVTNDVGEIEYIEKKDWYPPDEYESAYYDGPLTRYEPRLKTQSYAMGLYPDVVKVSFQTVKINGVNEEYKVVFVPKRMFELIVDGKTYEESKNIMLSEWVPPEPEWRPDSTEGMGQGFIGNLGDK